MQYFVLILLLI